MECTNCEFKTEELITFIRDWEDKKELLCVFCYNFLDMSSDTNINLAMGLNIILQKLKKGGDTNAILENINPLQ